MWDIVERVVDENTRTVCEMMSGNCTNIGKHAVLEAGEKIDHFFMMKEASKQIAETKKEIRKEIKQTDEPMGLMSRPKSREI